LFALVGFWCLLCTVVSQANPTAFQFAGMGLIIAATIVFRGLSIMAEPWLADDYQRYLFDGRLLLAGINPYDAIPEQYPGLGGDEIPKPTVKTIYPPLAEGLFALSAWLGGGLLQWRLLNLIPDTICNIIFYRYLVATKQPLTRVILLLWNPLLIKEGLHAADLEIWTLACVLAFLWLAKRRKIIAAADKVLRRKSAGNKK
jgi:hypothetical protein